MKNQNWMDVFVKNKFINDVKLNLFLLEIKEKSILIQRYICKNWWVEKIVKNSFFLKKLLRNNQI